MKLKKAQREALFEKFGGKCAYCGCELQKGFHADHIEPLVRNWWNGTSEHPERETFDNYNPSCAPCNIQKNSDTLEQFRSNIKQFVESLNSYSTQYKFAKKYGLLKETEIEVKFFFETYNQENPDYCICDFVTTEKDPTTLQPKCYTCKKPIKL